jgi:nucleoporin NUP82
VSDDIRQLIISPHDNYLAILTSHTVHIAVLPDSSHLTAPDTSPLRLKTYTLGPVTHVTSQSAIASVLWHPLGVHGTCVVTVTEDAVVRVWELSTTDRWSFDRPTLAIDLKKLVDGTSVDQDFGASVSGSSKTFSPDTFEMEVASACFGARSSGGWSSMTLWIAMREGDVYALCPLLPEKWSPPPTLIPSLSVSIVAKVARIEDDQETSKESKLLSQQQLDWMSQLDMQEPVISESPVGERPAEVYTRPSKPGRIPKLQGPFGFFLTTEDDDEELNCLLTDIYVIGAKIDLDELMLGEDEVLEMDDVDQEGLSMGVICLLSSSGRVTVCLDTDGVEAQWLPNTKEKHRKFTDRTEPPSLLTFHTICTLRQEEIDEESWPMFSPDAKSRYSFFVTHASGITFISLSPWVFRLESELQGSSTAGTDFRIDLLVKGPNPIRERLLTQNAFLDQPVPIAACTVLQDPDLSYFLFSISANGPLALTFEVPENEMDIRRSRSPTFESEPEPQPLLLCAPWPVYQPSHALEKPSALPKLLEDLRRGKNKRLVHEPIKLTPETLRVFTDVHKILSNETYQIGTAAAELFRQCERLRVELRDQIARVNEIAHRIHEVAGNDSNIDDDSIRGNAAIEKRISDAQTRQASLAERYEKVRKALTRVGSARELSDKEKAWIDEVSELSKAVLPSSMPPSNNDPSSPDTVGTEPWERYNNVKELREVLIQQASDNPQPEEDAEHGHSTAALSPSVRVPLEVRSQKFKQVIEMLDRESALVERAKARLERLTLAS